VKRFQAAKPRLPGGGGLTRDVTALNGLRRKGATWVRSHT